MRYRYGYQGCTLLVDTFGSRTWHRSLASLAQASPSPAKLSLAESHQVLRDIWRLEEDYPFASVRPKTPRKIVIDFSSPNIAKRFHAGHLRSTILGNFVANLCTAMGHNVHRLNYLGDWGTQCGIVLVSMDMFGSDIELEKDPLKYLLEIYVKGTKMEENDPEFSQRVQDTMNKMENGDQSLFQMWEKIRRLTVAEYLKVYKRLGITFDEITGESQFVKAAREVSARIGGERSTEKLLQATDDAGKRLLKSDGSSLYLSRDLAAVLEHARTLDFDQKLYVVDNSQHDHFQCLFQLARDLDELKDRDLRHIKFGRIRGLSTRQGKIQLLSEILDEAETSMKERIKRSKYARPRPEEMDEVAKTLALTVIFINDFKQKRQMDYGDPFSTLQQSEGDSGVFLQYNHARLCSVEKNSGVKLNPEVALDYLNEEEALALITHLSLAPSTAQSAMEEFEPVFIVKYLFQNAHLTSKALKTLRVKDRSPEVAEARLFLFHCSRIVTRSLMKLLGIQPLDAM